MNLESFDARSYNHQVTLKWKVAQHHTSSYLEIEHSSDKSEFTALAKFASDTRNEYQYSYYEAANGIHYYRLKMKDQNGMISYSPIKSLKMDAFENEILIFPNPTNDLVTLKLNGSANTLKLIDLYGRVIYKMQVQDNQKVISAKQLGIQAGNYFIQVENESGTSVYTLQVR